MNDNEPGTLPLPGRLFLQDLAPTDDQFIAIVDTPGFTPEGRALRVGDLVTPGDCKRAHVKWHEAFPQPTRPDPGMPEKSGIDPPPPRR